MRISEWLDEREADNVEVSTIELPADIAFEDAPDETLYFEEINPCGVFCRQDHPFATVERYGDWYVSRGRDSRVGLHSSQGEWQLITRDAALALRTARSRIESPP
ncbi:MAG: hypothetical protein WDA20_07705 [Desulfuromonadales bacterium]